MSRSRFLNRWPLTSFNPNYLANMSQFSTPGPLSVEIKDSNPPSRIEITESRPPDAQPLKIKEREGEKTGTHLIGLKDGVSMDELIDDLLKAVKRDDAKIGPRWESIRTFSGAFSASHSSSICNALAEFYIINTGTFGPESLKFLCSSSRVSYVEESGYVTLMVVQSVILPFFSLPNIDASSGTMRHGV